jgi:hypothetical protein
MDCILLKEIDLYEGSAVTIGANMETYAIRSAQDLSLAKEYLHDETEDFIRSIPRKQQLELRQLIARHISLAKIEPDELRQKTLDNSEPTKGGIDYKYILNKFKL